NSPLATTTTTTSTSGAVGQGSFASGGAFQTIGAVASGGLSTIGAVPAGPGVGVITGMPRFQYQVNVDATAFTPQTGDEATVDFTDHETEADTDGHVRVALKNSGLLWSVDYDNSVTSIKALLPRSVSNTFVTVSQGIAPLEIDGSEAKAE